LIDALERAERKGYLPDAMADRWAQFQLKERPAAAEPVCWLYQHGETGRTRIVMPDQVFTNAPGQWLRVGPLYQHPPAPLQPVAWLDEEHDCAYTRAELDGGGEQGLRPLYAAPPDHAAAMRQALDWLQAEQRAGDDDCVDPGCDECNRVTRPRQKLIDALRAALREEK
jgi:hypothetical protein